MSTVPIGVFLAQLDRIIDPTKAATWDVAGLQLGDPNRPLQKVAVCHEVTEAVAAEVERIEPDLVVTYHPLLFRPTTRIVNGRSPAGRAYRLLAAGVSLAVAHTAFDAAPGGTADAMAEALDLSGVRSFGPAEAQPSVKVVSFAPAEAVDAITTAMAAAGAGRVGNYTNCSFRTDGTGTFLPGDGAAPVVGAAGALNHEPEVRFEMVAPARSADRVISALVAAHPYEEPAYDVIEVSGAHGFIGRIGRLENTTLGELSETAASVFGSVGIRVAGDDEAYVPHVAVVPGSGGSFVGQAAGAGANVIVTGDVAHHGVIEALDRGLAVIDVGHAPSERPGIVALAGLVADIASSLGVEYIDVSGLDPTPWR